LKNKLKGMPDNSHLYSQLQERQRFGGSSFEASLGKKLDSISTKKVRYRRAHCDMWES
jgi:hypothetical protein